MHSSQVCRLHICLFFLNFTAPTEIYTLSLHDALPIFIAQSSEGVSRLEIDPPVPITLSEEEQIDRLYAGARIARSEEHTSELQSRQYLVCRLLLEKKKEK